MADDGYRKPGAQNTKQMQIELETRDQKKESLLDDALRTIHETKLIHDDLQGTMDGQQKVIKGVSKATDANIQGIKRTQTKLEGVVARQSYGCLYITIGMEVLLMIIMLIYM